MFENNKIKKLLTKKVRFQNKRKLISIFMISLVLIPLLSNIIVYAAGGSEAQKVSALNKSLEIWTKGTGNEPSIFTRNTIKDGATSVPANYLYGDYVKLITYRGEVSEETPDYYSNTRKVFGEKRYFRDANKKENDTDDLHVAGLATQSSMWTSVFGGISSFNYLVCSGIYRAMVYIKEIDFESILDLFTDNGTGESISDVLRQIFLRSDDGKLSIFMSVFLILWIIGMVGVAVKYFKGYGGIQAILKEAGFFILALFLFAFAVIQDMPSKISKSSIKIANAFNNGLAQETDGFGIFDANTGNADEDTTYQEIGLFSKTLIDNELCVIFDVNKISDLDLTNFKTKGVISEDKKLSVSNGEVAENNLGYMYWAGQSSIQHPYEPFKNKKIKYVKNGTENRQHWLIPDILEKSGGVEDAEINRLFKRINNPNGVAVWSSSLLFLACTSLFIICLFFALILLCEGKICLAISGIFMFVMPALVLWDKTRKHAMDISRMFIASLIRFVAGTLMFIIYLTLFNSLMGDGKLETKFIALLVFGLLVLLSPRILSGINDSLRNIEGYNALSRGLSEVNRRIDGKFSRNNYYGSRNRKSKYSNLEKERKKGKKGVPGHSGETDENARGYEDPYYDEFNNEEPDTDRKDYDEDNSSNAGDGGYAGPGGSTSSAGQDFGGQNNDPRADHEEDFSKFEAEDPDSSELEDKPVAYVVTDPEQLGDVDIKQADGNIPTDVVENAAGGAVASTSANTSGTTQQGPQTMDVSSQFEHKSGTAEGTFERLEKEREEKKQKKQEAKEKIMENYNRNKDQNRFSKEEKSKDDDLDSLGSSSRDLDDSYRDPNQFKNNLEEKDSDKKGGFSVKVHSKPTTTTKQNEPEESEKEIQERIANFGNGNTFYDSNKADRSSDIPTSSSSHQDPIYYNGDVQNKKQHRTEKEEPKKDPTESLIEKVKEHNRERKQEKDEKMRKIKENRTNEYEELRSSKLSQSYEIVDDDDSSEDNQVSRSSKIMFDK